MMKLQPLLIGRYVPCVVGSVVGGVIGCVIGLAACDGLDSVEVETGRDRPFEPSGAPSS